MALSLFGNKDKNRQQVQSIPLTGITPNRFQPRKNFDVKSIDELARTIQIHGLIQPIILREYEPNKYEIIAGERRFRAVTALKWETVPAIVQTIDDSQAASMALIENLQREELTSIEEAQAYQSLMALNHLTQEALAQRIGKSQSFVANRLRLLKLGDAVQSALLTRKITERHARALLGLDSSRQEQVLDAILKNNLTVKDTDDYVLNLSLRVDSVKSGEKSDKNTDIASNTAVLKSKKKSRKKAKINVPKDARLAINTIKQSIKLVNDSGLKISAAEENLDDVYRIVIEIPKDGSKGENK